MQSVDAILADLGLDQTPRLVVFNKIDRLENGAERLRMLCRRYQAVAVSAARREGLDALVDSADRLVFHREKKGTFRFSEAGAKVDQGVTQKI